MLKEIATKAFVAVSVGGAAVSEAIELIGGPDIVLELGLSAAQGGFAGALVLAGVGIGAYRMIAPLIN